MRTKLLIIVVLVILISAFYFSGAHQHLELASVQNNLSKIQNAYDKSPVIVLLAFTGLYIFITGLSIPGAIVLTLLSGAIFGIWQGTLLVTFCCTAGAVISFLTSRYLFKENIEKRFSRQFKTINNKLVHHGNYYFLTMRMVPVSPYVVINLVMGLTKMKLFTFAWMTFVGMLPGNFVFVLAGRKISQIESPGEILTWPILVTLTLIGLLPIIVKKIVSNIDKRDQLHSTN